MATQVEIDAMRCAIDAASATVRTLPNPRVGCVLLDSDSNVIACGAHRGSGTPHAEVDALTAAGDRARGATAVVTLEPCNHTGKTGPCVRALVDAGITRVIYGQSDPNPMAAGGAGALADAGLDVEGGVLRSECAALNVEWTLAINAGRPFVTWKFGSTLDGLSAAPDGTSRWITGTAARGDVHRLRATADATMIGTGTIWIDDPLLTVRDENDLPLAYEQQPQRVVVGESKLDVTRRVFDDTAPTMIIRSHDPEVVLKRLNEKSIRHVWLEGGPTLAGAFLEAGLIDRVIGYVAPALLGSGLRALNGHATTISDIQRLELEDVRIIGDDIRIMAKPHDTLSITQSNRGD